MSRQRIAFALGGGGHRGAFQVGMLKALAAAAISPDVVVGTSIGAINGALTAARPGPDGAAALEDAWRELDFDDLFPGGLWTRTKSAISNRTYLHTNDHLRSWLTDRLPADTFDDLRTHFECVAASIEGSAERWFDSGPLVDAILASSAVPGLLPPVEIDGAHYVDGGVVNSIPLSRAYELGATKVFVMHVGHVDDELEVPTKPWDVAVVAFEIARRHRFHTDLANVPEGIEVHVLPTGATSGRFNDPKKLRYSNLAEVDDNIASAFEASVAYLDRLQG